MPATKKKSKRVSKKSTTKQEPLKELSIEYEEEYESIKNFIEVEDLDKTSNYLNSLEKKVKRTKANKNYNKQVLEVLQFIFYSKFNKVQNALDLLKLLEESKDKIDTESLLFIDINIAKADVFWKIGKQKEALSLLIDLEKKIAKKELTENILDRIGELFNIKGIIYWMLGDVIDSQNAFQTSLSIMGKKGNKNKFARALNNLGNVYIYKGELNVALDHHLQALEIRKQIGAKNQIASSLGNIGEIYHYKGDYKKSLEYYLLAKQLFEEINNLLFRAKIYYQLISLHIEYYNRDHAKEVLDILDVLRKSIPSNDYIQMLYIFSEGLFFKTSERLLDKFHAAINFNSIILSNKAIDNEITVLAILNLTDILLLEIRLSNNEEILNDIHKFCRNVNKIALSQNSSVLQVQGYLLESKLKLLDFKFQEAKTILNKAVSLSQEKGISRFEYFASKELDKLLQTEEKWNDLKEKHAPLPERLDLTGIETTLMSLIRKREEKIEIEREDPVLFIILQEGGLTAFSLKFREEIKSTDDQLIGGFISAVNTFGQHIFSTTGQVERIKHGEYTLISKIVLDKLTFCYAFKGPSYLASKKFDKIINKFLNSNFKKIFLSNLRTGYLLDEKDDKLMQDLINNCIFLNEESEYKLLETII